MRKEQEGSMHLREEKLDKRRFGGRRQLGGLRYE